jgi:hypothetical protein
LLAKGLGYQFVVHAMLPLTARLFRVATLQ